LFSILDETGGLCIKIRLLLLSATGLGWGQAGVAGRRFLDLTQSRGDAEARRDMGEKDVHLSPMRETTRLSKSVAAV